MGRGPRLVQGSTTGGALQIPAGVLSVKITGQGGAGTSTYNPGQPYVAETQGYIDFIANFVYYGESPMNPLPSGAPSSISGRLYKNQWGSIINAYISTSIGMVYCQFVGGDTFGPIRCIGEFNGSTIQYGNGSITADVQYNPGQAYIAPWYTHTTGQQSWAWFSHDSGTQYTWNGNYGSGYPPPQQYTVTLPGTSEVTLNSFAASGTTLAYEYWE